MYSVKEINDIRNAARALHMSARPEFYNLAGCELTKICNGYGPDAWSEKRRKVMTWIYRNYAAGAAIHDVDFEFSDGTMKSFDEANDRFIENNKKEMRQRYPLWNPLLYGVRAWAWVKIEAAYVAVCSEEGFEAWTKAHERRVVA